MTALAGEPSRAELTQRLISAVVLASVTLAALWQGGWTFGLLMTVLAVAASWEWSRMVRGTGSDTAAALHASAIAIAAAMATAGHPLPALVLLLAAGAILLIWQAPARDLLSGLGVLAIGCPVVGLAVLRQDAQNGLGAVVFLFVTVWMTDTGAYAFGRSLGGPKLLPAISPGKTWAGAIGGLIFAAVAGLAAALLLGSRSTVGLIGTAMLLGLAAECGDLAESALKRRFGRKDASALIPGHGGVLDRIDGLLAASLLATGLGLLRDGPHPASGLVQWP